MGAMCSILGPDASKVHHMTDMQTLAAVCCTPALMLPLIYKLIMSTHVQLHLQVSLKTGKCNGHTQVHGRAYTHALAVWLQTGLTGTCQACRELSARS